MNRKVLVSVAMGMALYSAPTLLGQEGEVTPTVRITTTLTTSSDGSRAYLAQTGSSYSASGGFSVSVLQSPTARNECTLSGPTHTWSLTPTSTTVGIAPTSGDSTTFSVSSSSDWGQTYTLSVSSIWIETSTWNPPPSPAPRGEISTGTSIQIALLKVGITSPNENDVFLHGDKVTFKAKIDPSITVDSWEWEILEGVGSPSSSSTDTYEPIVRNADDDYDAPDIFKVKVTAIIDGCECSDELQIKVVYPKVDIIDFKSTKAVVHEGDWATHDPEWTSAMTDESVSVFTRNTKIKVDATVKTILPLTKPTDISRLYANVAWWVTGDCDLESKPTIQTLSGNNTVVTMEGVSSLIDEIYAYEESWQWTRNLKYEWFYEMPETGDEDHDIKPDPDDNRHDLYVTLDDPVNATVYETVLHISCNAARSESSESDTIDEIWDDFADCDVRKKDNTQMTYYANSAAPYTTPFSTVEELLQWGNGRCGLWQALFDETLQVQGITVQQAVNIEEDVNFVAQATAAYITKYGKSPAVDGYIGVRDVFFVKNWDLSSPDKWNAVDEDGEDGQGNGNPIAVFGDHALMRINGKIYDPSYGTGPFNNLTAWEDASVDGYGVQFIKSGMLAADFMFWIGKEDTKGLLEVHE